MQVDSFAAERTRGPSGTVRGHEDQRLAVPRVGASLGGPLDTLRDLRDARPRELHGDCVSDFNDTCENFGTFARARCMTDRLA